MQKGFLFDVISTYATKVVLLAFGFGVTVLTAREMGPESRGLYVYASLLATSIIQILCFGLPTFVSYRVSMTAGRVLDYLGLSLAYTLSIGMLCWLCAYIYYSIFDGFKELPISLAILVLMWIPVGMLNVFLQNIVLASGKIKEYNLVELIFGGAASFLTLMLVIYGLVEPIYIYSAGFIVLFFATAYYFRLIQKKSTVALSFSPLFVGDGWMYALRIYAASIFSFLLLKSDVFLVDYYLSKKQVGSYSISVGLIDTLYMLPVILGTILFPRLSSLPTDEERWKAAKPIVIMTALLSVVALVVMYVGAGALIVRLFGSAYSSSVSPFIYLLPGFVFLSINTVIMNYFSSIGAPKIVIFGPLCGFLVNIVGNVLMIPQYGVDGAAIMSSFSYGLMLFLSMVYIVMNRRVSAVKSVS